MTAYASLETAITAVNQGAYDYLLKPIEFSDLKLTIQRALEKREADREKAELLTELQQKNAELKKKVAELNALYKTGMSLSTTQNLRLLLNKIVSLATGVIEAESGSIMLIQSPENVLTIEAAIGLSPEIVKRTRLELGSSIAGHVAQKATPLIVEDLKKDPRFRHLSRKHYATRSLLCVPLRIKDKVLGVINVSDKTTGRAFTENDLRLLTTFASQAAIAIDDAEQFNQNLEKLKELSALYEIATHLSSVEDFRTVCGFVFDKIKTVVPIEFALWFEWSEAAKELVLHLLHGCRNLGWNLAISLHPHEVSDAERLNEKIKENLNGDFDLSPHLDTLVSFPIIAEGTIHGVLSLGNRRKEKLSDEQERLISIIVSQFASVYEKRKSMLNASRLITMGNLVSEITHDLKRPLTNIRGTLQLLQEKCGVADDKESYFSLVEEEIFRLDGLVKEIVSFSNPHKYEMQKRDIVSVLDRALKLVERDLASRNIVLKKEFRQGQTVLVDKNQMMEIFLNLILNAVDAMPQGGELRVGNNHHKDPKSETEFIQIEITDTGCGIPADRLSRIFDRYFTTKKEGNGLGLAVVDRIVKAHGGSVSVESEEGKGTTFLVHLPAI
jgi:signal transduction histidine kinase